MKDHKKIQLNREENSRRLLLAKKSTRLENTKKNNITTVKKCIIAYLKRVNMFLSG